MNYVVYDDLEEYNKNNDKQNKNYDKNNKNNKNNRMIIIAFVVIIILLIVVIYLLLPIDSTISSLTNRDIEKMMISSAKEYVNNNNLSGSSIYLTYDKLGNINLKDNCSKLSGVIVENNNYYPYLICNDYKSDVIENDYQYASLNGEEVVIVYKGYEYFDPGCKSNYQVKMNNNYENREGVYNFNYNIIGNGTILSVLNRKVIVIDNQDIVNDYPNIELIGDEIIYLNKNEEYVELGYKATDNYDGDITNKVLIKSDVNTSLSGEYIVNYFVTNSKGYTVSLNRRVIVREKENNILVYGMISPLNVINTNVTITLSIDGDSYNKTILPNNKTTNDNLINYEVNSNGKYLFYIYDKNDNVVTKEFLIENIDKEKPTATCKAITYDNRTEVLVSNVSEESCIYSYKIDNYNSDYISSLSYNYSVGKANLVNVSIQDKAGNVNNISCQLEKKLNNPVALGNKEYTDEKGVYCLEPYVCYKQSNYSSSKYQFCSTDSCGTINMRGCSITSVTTVISKYKKVSSNGELYTPYTLLTEVYNKVCSRYCSGSTTSKKVFEYLGLEVVGNEYYHLNEANSSILLKHLKLGEPAIVRVGKGWYTDGGHLMALLSANDKDLVYLSDPAQKGKKNSHGHAVNSFVPLNDVIKGCGSSCWFQMVKSKE